MKKRTVSSQRWLKEHFDDEYVKRAQKEGYPSRSAYKLLEIQARDHLLKPGMVVVDLGAAPGGWSMVAKRLVGKQGRICALDILPMQALAGVEFIQGDFTQNEVLQQLEQLIGEQKVDVVLCDIAPNLSGSSSIDQPRSMLLAELALDFAKRALKPNGSLLIKVFQGAGVEQLQKELRAAFATIKIRKPKASRARSKEVYFLAQGFRSTSSIT